MTTSARCSARCYLDRGTLNHPLEGRGVSTLIAPLTVWRMLGIRTHHPRSWCTIGTSVDCGADCNSNTSPTRMHTCRCNRQREASAKWVAKRSCRTNRLSVAVQVVDGQWTRWRRVHYQHRQGLANPPDDKFLTFQTRRLLTGRELGTKYRNKATPTSVETEIALRSHYTPPACHCVLLTRTEAVPEALWETPRSSCIDFRGARGEPCDCRKRHHPIQLRARAPSERWDSAGIVGYLLTSSTPSPVSALVSQCPCIPASWQKCWISSWLTC